MRYFRFGIIFIFSLIIASGLQVTAFPSNHPLSLQLVESTIDEPQHHSLPHKQPPNEVKDLDKSAPKTAAKPLSVIEIVKDVGSKVIKNEGGPEKYFGEVMTGYKKVYNDGLVQANEKRNSRIARGQKPTFFTDFIDGFTSTFVPSAVFTFKKIGLPVLKVAGYVYFGITTP